MVRFADSSTELNPDFLTEVVLYALSAADLTMLVALVFVLARNIVKLVVERRRGLPFSRFRAKLVLALLGPDDRAVRARPHRRQRADSQQHGEVVQPADRRRAGGGDADRAGLLPRSRGAALPATPARIARAIPVAAVEAGDLDAVRRAIEGEVAEGRVGLVEVYRSRSKAGPRADVVPLVAVESPGLPRGRVRASADHLASLVAGGGTDAFAPEPLEGGGELVRGGAAVRDAVGPRRRRRAGERLSVGRVGDARPADHRGVPEPQPAAGDAPADSGRLPDALRHDDADDSGQRDVDRLVSGQAHHASGAAARRRRARDRRRPPRSPHRAGDARRVRIARRGVQHDGRGAGGEPAQARALARSISSARTSSSTSAASTSRPCSSASPPASCRSGPTGRSRRSTARRCACSKSDRSVIGVAGRGGLPARGSRSRSRPCS